MSDIYKLSWDFKLDLEVPDLTDLDRSDAGMIVAYVDWDSHDPYNMMWYRNNGGNARDYVGLSIFSDSTVGLSLKVWVDGGRIYLSGPGVINDFCLSDPCSIDGVRRDVKVYFGVMESFRS